MGILESCQGMDTRMSISLDNQLFRQHSLPKYSHEDFYFQESKLPLFGDIFTKKIQNKTQFVMQTSHINRNPQVISLALKVYENSNQFILEKGNKIKILNCIQDPNILDSKLYIIKQSNLPHQQLMKVIPFNRFEEQKFKNGLYEVFMLNKNLKQSNNRFSYCYQDAFIIESGVDKDFNDKCLVIVGDFCNATLNQLIVFRKMASLSWTQNRFESLCVQLIRGLLELHKNNIAHRDIRPHNVYYSHSKKSFVLGNFHNAISIDQSRRAPNIGYNLSGVPYYLPRYLVKIGKREDFSEYYNFDAFQNDIYALGLTLLNALFLDNFMPVQILSNSLSKYQNKFHYLSILKSMVSPNPPSLPTLLQTLTDSHSTYIDEKSHIQSLRFKMKPQDEQFVQLKKKIANGYYQVFMYDQWVEEINEVVNYYELNNDFMQLAEVYEKIANIYVQHHQEQMMAQYFAKASQIYLKIANECLEEKKTQEAIKYLEKGIECNRKGHRTEVNADLANLLNKLAMAHHVKAEYQIARAFQEEALEITGKMHGEKSSQFAEMLLDSAKIESDFQEFKQAGNMLKMGKHIVERLEETADHIRLLARILQALGNNKRMRAIQRPQKCMNYRNEAQQYLLIALQKIQHLQGSIHPQIGSILMSLGNVYFDKHEFDKAKKSYQRSLIVKQHSLKGRFKVQVGQCLTYLANSQKCLKQYDKAIKHYDEAIQVFRKAYGNDHNENTAVAIGNLGLVYKELGHRKEEKEYLTLAMGILKDLYGEECPDYQYFQRQLMKG